VRPADAGSSCFRRRVYSQTVTTDERLAVVEEQVRALRDDLLSHHRDMLARIDGGEGIPWERSVRGRLHMLEGESVAATVAARALAEAQRERREASRERDADTRDLWSLRLKWGAFLVAGVAVLAPYLERLWP
jgi:hypothetical protein